MIRPIMKDPVFLSQKSEPSTFEDLPLGQDLKDTLAAHADVCVGMAANMIGVAKNVIIVSDEGMPLVMFDPVILERAEPFETEEGCLSLPGKRRTVRYRSIRVRYRNENYRKQTRSFSGWTAQIIQHELDHCSGILI